ncbi:MAG: universal stress protein [Gammaproteobacteria bacterium]|nr:MAG: universal stress protein [Gammaproteobacteria bacterium]
MFKHILVPTDGSQLSEKAVKEAVALAKEAHAKVTALHVIPKFHALTYHTEMLEATQSEYAMSAAEHAKDYLGFAESIAKAAEVDCDTVTTTSDHPFKGIIETAKKNDCDLILMASHGRHGIEGFLLGSETQKVLAHSDVPVLVYR